MKCGDFLHIKIPLNLFKSELFEVILKKTLDYELDSREWRLFMEALEFPHKVYSETLQTRFPYASFHQKSHSSSFSQSFRIRQHKNLFLNIFNHFQSHFIQVKRIDPKKAVVTFSQPFL